MTPNLALYFHQLNDFILKLWRSKWGIYKIALALFFCFSLIYFPEIIIKRMTGDLSTNDQLVQNFVNLKIQSPFTAYLNAEKWDHFSKRDLRITPYLIGNILHLEAIKLFYIQALILFPFFILLSLKTIHQFTKDEAIAVWGTIALIFTYVGNSYHYDTFFYDSFAYTGLLAALYFRRKWFVIPILVASFFVDERSLIPASLILLINYFPNHPLGIKSWKVQLTELTINNRAFWLYSISVGIYVGIRFTLYQYYGLSTPVGNDAGVRLGLAFIHKFKVPFAIFASFKLNFILIFLAIYQLIKSKEIIITFAYSIAFVLILITSTAVEDVTRSLGFGFLLIFVFYKMAPNEETNKMRLFCALIGLCNLLLPTYSLLLQLYQIPILGWIKLLG